MSVLRSAGGLLTGAAGRYAAAGVLLAAAAYQLLPARRACLRRLGAPHAGGGGLAAVRSGLVAGVWCLGSSWMLVAALVALGLMSPTWMIVISALVMADRLLPVSRRATIGAVALLAALAVGLLVAGGPSPPAVTLADPQNPALLADAGR